MRKFIIMAMIILLFGTKTSLIYAQTTSANENMLAHPLPQRTIFYNVNNSGVSKPITWGLDLAWRSESNIRRGIAFMGADRVDIVRSSFTPTSPLIDGKLQATELGWLNERLNIIGLLDPNTKVVLNCDHPTVDNWFKGNAARWAELIEVTAKHHQEAGRTVVSVSPFNEPDFGWGQGTVTDFYNIAGELRQNPYFDNIRISGGNTLNTDQALVWYNQLKDRLDEGNTHQLAGNFDNYAVFYETVRANGHHATNDELHNVMEAMVGVEYGMQTGIWWGTAELARGEFVKASHGSRLGYAEHRPNWTAASVYRAPDGKIQAFGGTSERQAVTTTYRFVSTDRDVFYDGYGPQREYTMVMPGGTGYQQGQTNAERVVNITWGDDIQPVIDGRYILVNRNSGMVMEVSGGSSTNGANVRQNSNTGAKYQQWNVTPVSTRIGGDFSYFTITDVNSGKSTDIHNWSLDNGGNIVVWEETMGGNQQWYLDYAGDSWFFIRSRHSALCLEVENASVEGRVNIRQWEKTGEKNQQWRFIKSGTTIDFAPPDAPSGFTATPLSFSVRLDWTANSEPDIAGYTIFRADTAGGSYQTIARNVKTTSFVDNTTNAGCQYYYTIKAIDHSLNSSAYSNEVTSAMTGENEMELNLQFEDNTLDNTVNLKHGAKNGRTTYVNSFDGTKAIGLNGTNAFVQLPYKLANHSEITIASWVYWKGGASWQRIFDFGNNQDENMFLTPSTNKNQLRFTIIHNGIEEQLNATALPRNQWSHVAITLSALGSKMYVNGELVADSNAFNTTPLDIKPFLNYIGRGQSTGFYLNGNVDDFRVYNYTLSADEIAKISEIIVNVPQTRLQNEEKLLLWPIPATDRLYVGNPSENIKGKSTITVFDMNGKMVLIKEIEVFNKVEIDLTNIPPGIYMLKLTNSKETLTRKFIRG